MLSLVVLPGLDGTATLHSAFVDAARASFDEVSVVAYPSDVFLDYAELECLARTILPSDRPFVLLAESFSGPVAIAIAANPPRNLVGLVLSTTFPRNPVPFASILRWLVNVTTVRMIPKRLLSWWLLGRWATEKMEYSLNQALLSCAQEVLRKRALAALRVDVTAQLRAISVPTLYLLALQHRLLARAAEREIVGSIRKAVITEIAGPHLLLQASPGACAGAIADFVAGLGVPAPQNRFRPRR